MAEFEVYFKDLTEEAQEKFIETIGNETFENSNYDVFPIAYIETED